MCQHAIVRPLLKGCRYSGDVGGLHLVIMGKQYSFVGGNAYAALGYDDMP